MNIQYSEFITCMGCSIEKMFFLALTFVFPCPKICFSLPQKMFCLAFFIGFSLAFKIPFFLNYFLSQTHFFLIACFQNSIFSKLFFSKTHFFIIAFFLNSKRRPHAGNFVCPMLVISLKTVIGRFGQKCHMLAILCAPCL